MRYKDPNNVSKQKILLESFKLFATKPFSDITFTDIEKVTGLSRGAILYHFKSKDEILASIIDRFIINKEYDLPTIDVSKSMWDNIKNFIAVKQRQQEFFTSIGIQNINRAFIYIAANCMNLLKEIPNETQQRLEKEKKAMQKKSKDNKKKNQQARPQVRVKRTNNIDWTKEYENDSFDDDDMYYTFR